MKAAMELKPVSYLMKPVDYSEIEGAIKTGMTVIGLGINAGDMRIDNLNELVDLFSNQDDTNKNIHEVNTP